MSGTFLSGPSVVAGPMLGNLPGGFPQEYGAEFGPSIGYQGDAVPDVRFSPINKDNPLPGSIPAHFNSPYFLQVDAIPAQFGAANIANVASVSSGVALTLAGGSFGVSPNIPMLSAATGQVVTPALVLDFGFGPASYTAGSTTLTPGTVSGVSTIGWYALGQWIVIDQGLSLTAPLIAQVTAIGATTLTLSAPAGRTGAGMVGSANLMSPLAAGSAVAHVPAVAAGLARLWDPQQCLTRGVAIASGASAAPGGGNFLVSGYDLFGNAQTERITAASAGNTAYGKKAWKGIVSVTPNFTDAHTYTVGTSDVIGFVTRSDRWEATNLFWAGQFLTAATGNSGWWTAADATSPATSTTGDVRGTYQVSSKGGQTVTAATSNGALGGGNLTGNRVAIYSSINLYNLIAATPQNTVPMYGVTPA